jgi:hypothetical protein
MQNWRYRMEEVDILGFYCGEVVFRKEREKQLLSSPYYIQLFPGLGTQTTWICTGCLSPVSPDFAYCVECGKDLRVK